MSSNGSRVCECATIATVSDVLVAADACARRSSAVAPGNHSASGISREPSTRSYGACARISKKSQIDDQKPSRSVTDQRQSSS